jgi:hypothetical protein
MDDFLKQHELGDYAKAFHDQGYDTLADVADIDDAELVRVGVDKVGHRKRLLRLLSQHAAKPADLPPVPAQVVTPLTMAPTQPPVPAANVQILVEEQKPLVEPVSAMNAVVGNPAGAPTMPTILRIICAAALVICFGLSAAAAFNGEWQHYTFKVGGGFKVGVGVFRFTDTVFHFTGTGGNISEVNYWVTCGDDYYYPHKHMRGAAQAFMIISIFSTIVAIAGAIGATVLSTCCGPGCAAFCRVATLVAAAAAIFGGLCLIVPLSMLANPATKEEDWLKLEELDVGTGTILAALSLAFQWVSLSQFRG